MRTSTWVFLVLAAFFVPCPAHAERVLIMWGAGVETTPDTIGFDASVTAFETKFNCKVRRLNMGAGGMDPQKLSTAIAGGVPPTLVRQDRFTVGDWAARDAFQPLDNLIARDSRRPNGIRASDYFPGAWKEAVYEGRVYAIPDQTSTRALYYNRALFRRAGLDPDKPPRTWEELRAAAVKLTRYDAQKNITQAGYLPNFGNVWLYMYAWQNGGEFMSADGRTCTLAAPENVEALAYMTSLYNAIGGRARVDAFSSGFRPGELDAFLTGKVAMKVDGNWFLDNIVRYNPSLDFAVAPAPVPADRWNGVGRFAGQSRWVTWSGGASWAIPRGVTGADRDLAWEFIKWDVSPEGQRVRYTAQGEAYAKRGRVLVPEMRANRITNAMLQRDFVPRRKRIRAAMQVFNDLLPVSRYRPVTFVGQRLWDEHVRAIDNASYGMTPAAAMRLGQDVVQKELDKALAREQRPVVPRRVFTGAAAAAIAAILLAVASAAVTLRRQGRNARHEARAAYVFAAPWILGFVLFTLGPVLASILLSFCDYDVLHAPRWVGWDNYRELTRFHAEGAIVLKAFRNVVFMVAVGVPLTMMTGLGIALLLNTKVRGMHWYRTAYYLPAVAPVVANAILWLWLFNPQYGLINRGWGATLTPWFGIAPPNWMTDAAWSKPAFVVMGVWGAGSSMILWLAGLQGVPQHLYEAAELDGAGTWSKFRNVMLPLLSPTIFFLAVMGVIGALQIFEIAYVMKGGQALGSPSDSTMMPVVLLFQNAFQYFRMGYASALAWLLFVVIFTITAFQLRLSQRWVHYGE